MELAERLHRAQSAAIKWKLKGKLMQMERQFYEASAQKEEDAFFIEHYRKIKGGESWAEKNAFNEAVRAEGDKAPNAEEAVREEGVDAPDAAVREEGVDAPDAEEAVG